MQGRVRNLCHEELLINSVQDSCDFNCKTWQWVTGLGAKQNYWTPFIQFPQVYGNLACGVGHGYEEQLYTRIFEVVVLIIAFIISISVTHSPSCACTLSIPRHWWDMGIVLDHPAVQDGEFNVRLFRWGEQRTIFRQAFWWAMACVLLLLRYYIEVDYPKREKSSCVWTSWGTWEASVAGIPARPELKKGGTPNALVGHFALTVKSIK